MSEIDTVYALPDGEFQRLFASLLMHDADAASSFLGGVRPEYFGDQAAQYLVRFALAFQATYHAPPPSETIAVEVELDLERGKLSEEDALNILTVYDVIYRAQTNPPDQALVPYIRDKAGLWLKQAALTEAAQQTADDVASGRQVDYVKRFQDAMLVGERLSAPGAMLVKADRELYAAELESSAGAVIGTGLAELDDAIAGGLHIGGVGVFMAATGKGKSHALVFAGRNAMMAGLNVVHVTLEMDKLSVWSRYAAGITGVDSAQVQAQRTSVVEKFTDREELYPGDVAVFEYPTRTASVTTLRALLNHVIQAKSFTPQVLVVDYADLLRSASGRKDAAQWESQGVVYEELRALAREFNLVIWTATQTNRDGHRSTSGADLDMIGDSYAKAQVADLIIALSGDTEKDKGEVKTDRWFVPRKVRNGLAGAPVGVTLDGSLSTFTYNPDAKVAVPPPAAEKEKTREDWGKFDQGGKGFLKRGTAA